MREETKLKILCLIQSIVLIALGLYLERIVSLI